MTKLTSLIMSFAFVEVLGCAAMGARPAPPSPPPVGPEWAPLRALVGTWSGSGGDATHPSQGGFTIAPELGGKLLVRRGTNDTATAHHEDLTLIYRTAGGELQASYFDNEGHAIHYVITPSTDGRSVVFLGDETPGAPRFRLTYDLSSANVLSVTFDMAPPGSTLFQPYITGQVHRTGA